MYFIIICNKMTEPRCAENDYRQQPLTLVSKQRKYVWSPFLSCFSKFKYAYSRTTTGTIQSGDICQSAFDLSRLLQNSDKSLCCLASFAVVKTLD